MGYLKFQLKNSIPDKKFILILFLLVSVVMFFFSVNLNDSNRERSFIDEFLKFTDQDAENNLKVTENQIDTIRNENEEVADSYIDSIYKANEELTDMWLKSYRSFHNREYRDYLEYELVKLEKFDLESYSEQVKNGSAAVFGDSNVLFVHYYNGKTLLNTELIERNLPYESTRYGTSNYMFVVSCLDYITSIFGIAIFILLLGKDYLVKVDNRKIRLNVVQPISKLIILLSDCLLFMFKSVLLFLFLIITAYLVGTIFGGAVPYDYPMLTLIDGQKVLMPIYQYIIQTSLVFFLVLLFVFLLCYGCVLLVKNSYVAIFLTCFFVFGMGTLFQTGELVSTSVSAYNVFTYTSSNNLIKGKDDIDIGYLGTNNSWFAYENPAYYGGYSLNAYNSRIGFHYAVIVLPLYILFVFFGIYFALKSSEF